MGAPTFLVTPAALGLRTAGVGPAGIFFVGPVGVTFFGPVGVTFFVFGFGGEGGGRGGLFAGDLAGVFRPVLGAAGFAAGTFGVFAGVFLTPAPVLALGFAVFFGVGVAGEVSATSRAGGPGRFPVLARVLCARGENLGNQQ